LLIIQPALLTDRVTAVNQRYPRTSPRA